MNQDLCENAEGSSLIDQKSKHLCWHLNNLEETIALGELISKKLGNSKLLLLEGPLGAGKTSLVKGIAKGLSITEPITSPTFALSQHYPSGTPPLIHMDLYRIDNFLVANELFLQEEETAVLLKALMVIEWPERLTINLPDASYVKIKYHSNHGRIVKLKIGQ